MTDKDELAALRKRIEELEAKANPPEKKPFVPMTDAEWRHQMHSLLRSECRWPLRPL